MKSPPRIGATHETTFTVAESHTISLAGLPPVLATPWLVWFLEHAALDLLAPHLSDSEVSVGTHIDLEHLTPAVVGALVTCRARVIHVDGPVVTFQVDAGVGNETLSRGLHRRRIVESARLARRLSKMQDLLKREASLPPLHHRKDGFPSQQT